MDIDKTLDTIRAAAETARRESGGTVTYVTSTGDIATAHVRTDAGSFIYTVGPAIGSESWHSVATAATADSYREAVALGGEQ